MPNIVTAVKKSLLIALALIMVNVPTAAVYADEAPICTPPNQTQSGVRWPNGADASAFTYQCEGAYSGQWLSSH